MKVNPAGSDVGRILCYLDTETNLYNKSVLYAYFPRSTAKTVAIATKVAVRFGNFNINVYLCTAKTVAIATKVAVRIV